MFGTNIDWFGKNRTIFFRHFSPLQIGRIFSKASVNWLHYYLTAVSLFYDENHNPVRKSVILTCFG